MAGQHRRIYLSASRKSSGKTCLSVGLLHTLVQRGATTQPFKKGPDYIDPMWLSHAAGRPCYNLDYNTQSHQEILDTAARGSATDYALIEGNLGLFDGMAEDGSDSNAALAKLLQAPVALVLDCEGMARGIAPLVLGYQQFDPELRWAGVILNRTAGSRHESKLVHAVEQHTDLPVLGAVGRSPDMELAERHLGLITHAEQADAAQCIEKMGRVVADSVDAEKLFSLAGGPDTVPETSTPASTPESDLRIGYARDAAFGFYYADDLEWFARLGAELIPFDTLRDTDLPEMDGLWIGGGFPETQAEALSANVSMKKALSDRVTAGLPTYAECGGLMYLSRQISWEGRTHDMVGIVPGDCIMNSSPQGRGLVELEATGDFPWPEVPPGLQVPAHEFHYSRLENLNSGLQWGWRVRRGTGTADEMDGLILGNLFASYCHLRHTERFEWIRHFLGFVQKCTRP